MASDDGAIVPAAILGRIVAPNGPAVHYSTGRLTRVQAATVNAWRARLRLDKPMSGQPLAGPAARMLGGSDRPRASCSDAVAAAVADLLLRRLPEPLELARYAYASMQAAQTADRGADADAPLYPPVSWYLPAWLSASAEQLRASAWDAARRARDEAEADADQLYPGTTQAAAMARYLHVIADLARVGLPFSRQVPRGAIARMAIDLWAPRHPDDVAADAVAYAGETHQQPHRARRDMRTLAR